MIEARGRGAALGGLILLELEHHVHAVPSEPRGASAIAVSFQVIVDLTNASILINATRSIVQ
jgi:hypothetical protein